MLTASGGPFRGRTRDELAEVTVEEALQHPTWSMGPVITINSATLVNKGLEVIEAHLLFDIPFDRIDVVVHPTSDVHSMVEFVDGSTILQASPPTMMIPIALGLAWPDRVPDAAPAFDWSTPGTWEFFPLDDEAFPAVVAGPARAGELGGTAPGRLQRRQRGVRRGVPRRAACASSTSFPRLTRSWPPTTYDRGSTSPWTTSSPPMPGRARRPPPPSPDARREGRPCMTALLYTLGVVAFVVAILVSIGLHEFGHLIPAKKFGVQGAPVVHRLRAHRVEQADRRHRVRRQGDPARRLRQDRRDAAPGRRRTSSRRRRTTRTASRCTRCAAPTPACSPS